MQHERETLCKYRLERAKEDLQAAHVNHESGLFKAAINRPYYTILYTTGTCGDFCKDRRSIYSQERGKSIIIPPGVPRHVN